MILEWLSGMNPIWQAFVATCFTWFVTALGAAMVLSFLKSMGLPSLKGNWASVA